MTDKQDTEIIWQGHKLLDHLISNEVPVSRCVLLMLDHVVACCNKPDLHWGSLPFYTDEAEIGELASMKKEPTMITFCLTFASDHPLGNHWIEVEAADEGVAGIRVFEVFGNRWCFLYAKEHFKSEYFPDGKVGRTLRVD